MEEDASDEKELTEKISLCGETGRLNRDSVGWSRAPVHDCALPGSWGRRKRWDYWCVTSPEIVVTLTYANVDYLGIADIWVLERATGRTASASRVVPLAIGFSQPDEVGAETIRYSKGSFEIVLAEDSGGTQLLSRAPGRNIACDIFVERPDGHETMSVVIPWSETEFQCTTKENTRPASGWVEAFEQRFELPVGESWGCLDYGRGKWPYSTVWNWGSASGTQGGRVVGLQLGGKWTDGTGMTENALCVDGRLTKIGEELTWEYDSGNWLAPWRIFTPNSDKIDLTLRPDHDKASRLELGVLSSTVHQCFGQYSGAIVSGEGERIEIDSLFGWAEEARWRW
ncbi:MAG: DUF2804 domain-containing protein [Acidobacteria bacterium]|nr:MAG: DUF2804 domain-containing protein [Acidobacteriota bacterium]